MSNCPHVCLEHRYVAKASKWVIRRCPVDSAPLVKFSPQTRIPKKTDDLGWARLRASYRQGQRRNALTDYARYIGENPTMFYWKMRRADRLLERWRG